LKDILKHPTQLAEDRFIYEFGDFRLDAARHLLVLKRDGRALPLTQKAFETLWFLVRHSGELLDKRTLMDAVWPNLCVEDNNLNQCISTLRQLLGDTRDDHRFIVTIPGRGYRFVADVKVVPSEESHPDVARATLRCPRLAIMPFANLSPDPSDAFFADGLHEEILSTLSRCLPAVAVISRTTMLSYRQKPKPIGDIAHELGATHVMEGAVRREGDHLRLTLQLVDAETDRYLWSQTYDRTLSSAMTLESEIATDVASRLCERFDGAST
jgi:TolB-like protein